MYRTLEHKYSEELEESPELSNVSPFGPLTQHASRKTLYYLIATLNASFPDYDFRLFYFLFFISRCFISIQFFSCIFSHSIFILFMQFLFPHILRLQTLKQTPFFEEGRKEERKKRKRKEKRKKKKEKRKEKNLHEYASTLPFTFTSPESIPASKSLI